MRIAPRRGWFVLGAVMASVVAGAVACSSFGAEEATTSDDAGDAATPDGEAIDAAAAADGAADAASSLPSGLLAYWKFENDGADETGRLDQIMTFSGTTFVKGVRGRGLHCGDGTVAKATNENSNLNLGSEGGTVLAWIQLDAIVPAGPSTAGLLETFHTILDKGQNWTTGGSVGPGYGFGYISTDTGYLVATVGDGDASVATRSPTTQPLTDGKFHMVAFAVDLTAGTIRVYADGALIMTKTGVKAGALQGTMPLQLCKTMPYTLRGSLDEMMLFDHALDTTQINRIKRAIEPPP